MGSLTDTQGITSAQHRVVQAAIYPLQLATVICDLLNLVLVYTVGWVYCGYFCPPEKKTHLKWPVWIKVQATRVFHFGQGFYVSYVLWLHGSNLNFAF